MSAMVADASTPPLAHLNGNGVHMNEDGIPNGAVKEPKYASGLILPPPEIKCEHSHLIIMLNT